MRVVEEHGEGREEKNKYKVFESHTQIYIYTF
jgi:hypothetical protein